MDLNKKFSIAHHDNCSHPSQYYEAIQNPSQDFRDELYDIYFGKIFRYNYREQEIYDNYSKSHEVAYGNVMGENRLEPLYSWSLSDWIFTHLETDVKAVKEDLQEPVL